MYLPEISQLRQNQSTYITFSKSSLDLDRALTKNTKYYFSKMVVLKLPNWASPDFTIDLSSVGINSTNPNLLFPKTIQYYLENIINQNIGLNDINIPEKVELAFWKMLRKMGISNYKDTVKIINTLATSNFVEIDNNTGWCELVGQIPNKCQLLVPAWKTISNVVDIVPCVDPYSALYDNNEKEYIFENYKDVIDFDNVSYDSVTEQTIDFNCILLYYKDSDGIDKLHGINFINPFEPKATFWELPTYTQKTNTISTVGYQFKFVQKTCTNEPTRTVIIELQDHTHWNVFSKTLELMNSFLETKIT